MKGLNENQIIIRVLVLTLVLLILVILGVDKRESVKEYKYRLFAEQMIKNCSNVFGKHSDELKNTYVHPVCNKIRRCTPFPSCEDDEDSNYWYVTVSLKSN